MNLLKKTTPWMAASLMAVASIFGQDTSSKDRCADKKNMNQPRSFEQGQDILKAQAMPAYTAPGTIEVRGAWDFFVTGSFIYWQPTQDNMEYGLTNSLTSGATTGTTGLNGNWLEMNFKFEPGFKVGIGMNTDYDNWDVFAEYTWLRDTSTSSFSAPAGTSILPTRGVGPFVNGALVANSYSTASQSWTCNLDFLNLEMGRSCYLGRALTIRPSYGVRGTLMRQKLNDVYVANATAPVPGTLTVMGSAHSWSVGPRLALNTNWLMGCGFRLYGNAANDVTFTQYTIKTNQQFQYASTGATSPFRTEEKKLGGIRDHIEMELGFGWGTYFDNANWYFDLSAGYTWQVFFNQNVFRELGVSSNFAKANYPAGNLYINGLTVNARFDF